MELIDFLILCEKYDKVAVVEIKSYYSEQDIKDLLFACRPYLKRITFISFFYDCLIMLREQGYTGPIQYLSWKEIDDHFINQLRAINADADIHHNLATKEVIDRFHSLGININVWTLIEIEKATTLIRDGVDYITTDILE